MIVLEDDQGIRMKSEQQKSMDQRSFLDIRRQHYRIPDNQVIKKFHNYDQGQSLPIKILAPVHKCYTSSMYMYVTTL